ncbi:putative oxidoreductase domain protein [Vibrio parahaemolyticus AQ3810]|nr:putative oxidoreductase domain protein [Vibrio parahaemolyticus AQ3810]
MSKATLHLSTAKKVKPSLWIPLFSLRVKSWQILLTVH